MTGPEAWILAVELHTAGVKSVRVVEWLDDGHVTLIVGDDTELASVDAATEYLSRHPR